MGGPMRMNPPRGMAMGPQVRAHEHTHTHTTCKSLKLTIISPFLLAFSSFTLILFKMLAHFCNIFI